MSDETAISVQNVSKVFRLPHERNDSLKSTVINFYKTKRTFEEQQALKDVSFEVKKGEFFGIVGRNGSGKSTMLKMLAGIYAPSGGKIHINGKLTPFIELGVGFNPELTGRENIFLNGALLGFNRTEMRKMYKDIVEFAELEKFMDQKLKNYSSGMQVRLAFSIAIRAKSDILLIDEVLAVGDSNFQKKCFEVFDKIKASGRTIVLVTHDMGIIKKYCDRALMLKRGLVVTIDSPAKTAVTYEIDNIEEDSDDILSDNTGGLKRLKNAPVKLNSIELLAHRESKAASYAVNDPIKIDFHYDCSKAKKVIFAFNFTRKDGLYICGFNAKEQLGALSLKKGKGTVRCTVKAGQLTEGAYYVNGTIYDAKDFSLVDFMDAGLGIKVPIAHVVESKASNDGVFNLEGEWSHDG